MEYTQNYHLPQWVKEDRIMMEDFNEMNGSIEEGLTQTAAQAAEARAPANAASQNASAALAHKNYVVGSYVGTSTLGDGKDQAITLGFRPSFLIVSGAKDTRAGTDTSNFTHYILCTGGNSAPNRIRFTSTGFVACASSDLYYMPIMNELGRKYDYIAFR